MTNLPLDDWQFWVVSVIALAALVVVLRMVVPAPLIPRPFRRRDRGRRATLTVGGKPVEKP